MRKKLYKIAGFTFIELLVTISIILIITGGGIAAFVNFNDRQQVLQTSKNIQELMRAAQVKARAGERANDCTLGGKLKGYRVDADSNNVYLRMICVNPETGVLTNIIIRSQVSLINVTLTLDPMGGQVTFLSLLGGVDTAGAASVAYTVSGKYNTGIKYKFEVKNTGEITEGVFQ